MSFNKYSYSYGLDTYLTSNTILSRSTGMKVSTFEIFVLLCSGRVFGVDQTPHFDSCFSCSAYKANRQSRFKTYLDTDTRKTLQLSRVFSKQCGSNNVRVREGRNSEEDTFPETTSRCIASKIWENGLPFGCTPTPRAIRARSSSIEADRSLRSGCADRKVSA